VQDEQGRYFLLYHAYSTTGTVFTGREGMLDEVKFGPDDWPTINQGNGPSAKSVSPFGAVQKAAGLSYADDFAGDNLESGWQWPQNREPLHQLRDGKLRLGGGGRGTNFLAAVLARSTITADYVATAVLETALLKPGCAAGLCAFGDAENAMGVVLQDESIILWRRDRGETRQLAQQLAPAAAKLFLRLTARHGYRFQFAVSADDDMWIPCGEAADAKNLPPWDRSVRVALTVGGGADAEGVFDSFSIKPLEPQK